MDLSDNKLTEIPETILSLENLKKLNASNNEISEIPDNIHRCSSLFNLDFSYNNLTTLDYEMIWDEGARWKINVDGNSISPDKIRHFLNNTDHCDVELSSENMKSPETATSPKTATSFASSRGGGRGFSDDSDY